MADRTTSLSLSNQSDLSSGVDSPESFFELKGAAETVLNKRAANGEGEYVGALRIFVEVLPHDGQRNLYDDIVKCDGQLKQLRDSIVSSLILPMKATGQTPTITPSPRPGGNDDLSEVASEIEPSRRVAYLKNDCLERDGWRCVVTRLYDSVAASMLDTPDDEIVQDDDTECAHIIPSAFANFSETGVREHAAMWEALYRYFPDVKTRLQPQTINDQRNAMTLTRSLHFSFGKFRFSLEETVEPNAYYMREYKDFPKASRVFLPNDRIVRMVNHQEKYPLPDPVLLRVHASIAKFLHMSGMGEYIDKIVREREDIGCFAIDGSTNVEELLAF